MGRSGDPSRVCGKMICAAVADKRENVGLWTSLCPLERGEGGGRQRVDGRERGVLPGPGRGLTCRGRELRG